MHLMIFFCGIGHKFASKFENSLPRVHRLKPEGSFTIPDIEVDFADREIMSMSNSKSTGLDNISVKFLKISVHAIADILTFIMNCSIRSAVFIDDWEEA